MVFDPIVLFFVAGIIIKLCMRQLHIPAWLNRIVSLSILITVGLKGGMELYTWASSTLLVQMGAVIALSALTYFCARSFLYHIAHYDYTDAVIVAAHYGSVSVTTFAVALAVIQHEQIPFEPYIPLFVALMELPAVIIASIELQRLHAASGSLCANIVRTFTCPSISMLLLSIAFGYFFGATSMPVIQPLLFDNFRLLLALLLLEMGILVGDEFSEIKDRALSIIATSVSLSLIGAFCGLVTGALLNLSSGGVILLMVLAASASYIAVPAVLRQSNTASRVSFALGHALGVTFPFNIFIGIYLYMALVKLLYHT